MPPLFQGFYLWLGSVSIVRQHPDLVVTELYMCVQKEFKYLFRNVCKVEK